MNPIFGTIKVVDLTDFYLTREEHNRAIRRTRKRIGKCESLAFTACLMIGVLIGAVVEQKKRIDDLEERLDKKDETAG